MNGAGHPGSQDGGADGTSEGGSRSVRDDGAGWGSVALLREVVRRLRSDPLLAVPFACAGLLVAVVDLWRRRDPLPVSRPDSLAETLNVQATVVPSGVARTTRHAGALVDLQPTYLVPAVGLELFTPFVVAVAGWVTVGRASTRDRTLGGLARYFGVVLAVVTVPTLLGSPTFETTSLFVSLFVLVVVAFLTVRVFLVPGYLVGGDSFVTAVRRSRQASTGNALTILGVAVVFGTVAWALAKAFGQVGGGVSTALVGAAHAVALAVLVDWSGDRPSPSPNETSE